MTFNEKLVKILQEKTEECKSVRKAAVKFGFSPGFLSELLNTKKYIISPTVDPAFSDVDVSYHEKQVITPPSGITPEAFRDIIFGLKEVSAEERLHILEAFETELKVKETDSLEYTPNSASIKLA